MEQCECPMEEYLKLAELFKLFGDPTRVKILHLLRHKERAVNEIAEELSMTKSAVSHQLKVLKMSNLVKARRDGQNVYYSFADAHVEEIINIGLEHIREEETK